MSFSMGLRERSYPEAAQKLRFCVANLLNLPNLLNLQDLAPATCSGPADMSLSMGLHEKHNYDLSAALSSEDMASVCSQVLQVGAWM